MRTLIRFVLLLEVSACSAAPSPSRDDVSPGSTSEPSLGSTTHDPSSSTSSTPSSTGQASSSTGEASSSTGGSEGSTGGSPVPTHPVFDPPELGDWTGEDPPDLTSPGAPPGLLATLDADHFGGLPCGPHPETVFDLLLPRDVDGPLPLLVYIHGGGFTSGSRLDSFTQAQRSEQTRAYVEAGFAYATIDYRFQDSQGIRTPLQDSQVCVQYLRHHAESLGAAPHRMVLAGSSAGAGTSVWLGTSDDLADASLGHTILATSTRVPGVILDRTQAGYDVIDWKDDIFAPEYTALFDVALGTGAFDGALRGTFGIAPGLDPLDVLTTDPAYLEYRDVVDSLAHLDATDAEIWAETQDPDKVDPTGTGTITHHPFHLRALLAAGAATGLPVQANAGALGERAPETRVDFALRITAE